MLKVNLSAGTGLKVLGLTGTMLGGLGSVITGTVQNKQMKQAISEEVAKQVAEALSKVNK